jgi:hypothetical protein
MGTWGVQAFDNDYANDWAYELEETDDLSAVESAFELVEETEADDVEAPDAANALAACEVLARLNGKPGYQDAYTEKVDEWVAAHPIKPSAKLLTRANAVIDKILSEESELRLLWDDSDSAAEWLAAVEDLRARLRP